MDVVLVAVAWGLRIPGFWGAFQGSSRSLGAVVAVLATQLRLQHGLLAQDLGTLRSIQLYIVSSPYNKSPYPEKAMLAF